MNMLIPKAKKSDKREAVAYGALQFDKLVSYLKLQFMLFPDSRQGFNTRYSMLDAGLGAFSVFFMQAPSFLSHQTQLQERKGKNNASSLFQIKQIMSDNQIRNLLDPVAPVHLKPVFSMIYNSLKEAQNG